VRRALVERMLTVEQRAPEAPLWVAVLLGGALVLVAVLAAVTR
jgi:zinc transporter ZupT